MSIVKFKDLPKFDDETIQLALKSSYNVELQRAINSPKYLVIDWRDVYPKDIDLSGIDEYYMEEYATPENINNVEVLKFFTRRFDRKDPPTLWIKLVDSRFISNALYEMNTEEENFAMLVKKTKFKLPL